MIFQTTERLSPDVLPIQRKEMFRLDQHFSFTKSQAPSLDVQTAWLGDSRLCRVRSTGHLVRLIEPDNTSVLIPRSGGIEVETATTTLVARPGQTLMFTPNRRISRVFPDETGRSECDCILVPTVIRDESLSRPAGWLRTRPGLARSYPNIELGRADAALRQYLDLLFAAGMQNRSFLTAAAARQAAAVLLAEMVADLIDDVDDAGRLATSLWPAEERLVRAALEIMRGQLGEPISTRDVAATLGVGVRRLQHAFQRVQGATPRAVLGG